MIGFILNLIGLALKLFRGPSNDERLGKAEAENAALKSETKRVVAAEAAADPVRTADDDSVREHAADDPNNRDNS